MKLIKIMLDDNVYKKLKQLAEPIRGTVPQQVHMAITAWLKALGHDKK